MVTVVVVGIVGVVVAFLALTSLAIGRVSRRTTATWIALERTIDERRSVAQRLGETVRSYIGDETPIKELAVASAACAQSTPATRGEAERDLMEAVSAVVSLATQYPELRGDPVYGDLHDQLEAIQTRVATMADDYRQRAARLNARRREALLRPAALLLRVAPAPAFDVGALGLRR